MLRRVHDMPTDGLGLPTAVPTDESLVDLRPRLDHPWIADRADELSKWLDRFEVVLACARITDVPLVSHDDLGGLNLLLDDAGRIVAVLYWDSVRVGPREDDLWLVIDQAHPRRFLEAYDITELRISRSASRGRPPSPSTRRPCGSSR